MMRCLTSEGGNAMIHLTKNCRCGEPGLRHRESSTCSGRRRGLETMQCGCVMCASSGHAINSHDQTMRRAGQSASVRRSVRSWFVIHIEAATLERSRPPAPPSYPVTSLGINAGWWCRTDIEQHWMTIYVWTVRFKRLRRGTAIE